MVSRCVALRSRRLPRDDGGVAVVEASVVELSAVVAAPAQHLAVRPTRAGVLRAGEDLRRVFEPSHLGGREAVEAGAVTELTEAVAHTVPGRVIVAPALPNSAPQQVTCRLAPTIAHALDPPVAIA